MREEIRERILKTVEREAPALKKLALEIHSNPELGLREFKAAELLSTFLERLGFDVETGIAGLPTAFRASFGSGKPACAFMAEYDALPEIGHACGHNLIAAASVGAGAALKEVVGDLGGTVVVLGTPGEESLGGKVTMLAKGAFDGVDFALMAHPADRTRDDAGCNAVRRFVVSFKGRSSHAAAAPEQGVNALDAVILTFNGVNALRQHLRESTRIHGIITRGGLKPNVVPDFAQADFYLRSDDDEYLDELTRRFHDIARGAALMTGAELDFTERPEAYKSRKPCPVLSRIFREEAETLGFEFEENPEPGRASTDAGDVSHAVPTIHPYFKAAPRGTGIHSTAFAAHARTEEALTAALDTAKALALTAARVMAEPVLLAEMKKRFRERSRK